MQTSGSPNEVDCYALHGHGPTLLNDDRRRRLVAEKFSEACVSLGCRPIEIAYGLGLKPHEFATTVCGPTRYRPGHLEWRWHHDPRVEGGRIAYQLAQYFCALHGIDENEAGIWRIAEELVLPFHAAGVVTSLADAFDLQQHAPREMLTVAFTRMSASVTVARPGLRVARNG